MDVPIYEARPWFCPRGDELRFLPEGPRVCGKDEISWVAIQHGSQATYGSLNVLRVGADLSVVENRNYVLDGRPGFAMPTTTAGQFLVGKEKQLVVYDITDGRCRTVGKPVEQDVTGTIINDAEMFEDGLVFGAKDVQFTEPKAGLYLYRSLDGAMLQLRSDQVCSNGKVLKRRSDQTWTLWDIDTPRKQVVQYCLDVARGTLHEERVAIDLTDDEAYPDGMVETPDGQSVIIAMYNPHPAPWGEARQYSLTEGRCERLWRVPGSPQVTCPQLFEWQGRVYLVLTTAVEYMPDERKTGSPYAGWLFLAETPWHGPLRRKLWDIAQRKAVWVE